MYIDIRSSYKRILEIEPSADIEIMQGFRGSFDGPQRFIGLGVFKATLFEIASSNDNERMANRVFVHRLRGDGPMLTAIGDVPHKVVPSQWMPLSTFE